MSAVVFEIPVRGPDGKEIEKISVEASRIDERVRPRLLKEAVVMYQANKRVGTHETRTRSHVAGSNKKPWRQKGTGRARAGTRRSPLWRGGGIIFGPHPRDYSFAIPRSKRRLALRSALYAKLRDGQVVVIDNMKFDQPKTKELARILKALGSTGRCLIGLGAADRNLVLSARNIRGAQILPVKDFNALEVLLARLLVLTRDGWDSLLQSCDAGHSRNGHSRKAKGEEVGA